MRTCRGSLRKAVVKGTTMSDKPQGDHYRAVYHSNKMEITHHLPLILGTGPEQGSMLALTLPSFHLSSLDFPSGAGQRQVCQMEECHFCLWPVSLIALVSRVYLLVCVFHLSWGKPNGNVAVF